MKKTTYVLAIALCSAFSVSVHATEGALEINQACVETGCFPGDTAGYPVTISNRGNYVLTSDLVIDDPEQTIIRVDTDNVTIDMKGFGLFGINTCTGAQADCSESGAGTGIASLSTRTNISILNGLVQGMGWAGINIGEQSLVANVTAEHNGRVGIFVRAGSTVRNSNGNFNGYLGMEAHESRLVDCSAADNGQVGLAVNRSIVVRAVALRSDNQVGILDGYGSQIHDSLVRDNPAGIESINGATSVINSTVLKNKGFGIYARGDTGQDPAGMPVVLRGNTLVLNNGGNANDQIGGSGKYVELGPNYCGQNTTCP